MTFSGLLNFRPPKIPPGTPLGSGGSIFFRFESVPYPSEYVCQIWLRSDRRECNAGMTIAKCTKTAASSNVSNHLSRTPAAWCASGAAHHARPYRNLGRRISLRSYTIVDGTTGETPRARTRAKVVISCSTFSNADYSYKSQIVRCALMPETQ